MLSFTSSSLFLLSLVSSVLAGNSHSKRAYPGYPCPTADTGDLCTLNDKQDFALSSLQDTFNFTARGAIGSNSGVEYVSLAFQKANTTEIRPVGDFFGHWNNDFGIFEGENVAIPCSLEGSQYLNIVAHTFSGVAKTPSVGVKTFGPFNVTGVPCAAARN